MAAALLNTSLVKEKFLVGGPQALTGSDIAEILNRKTGRKIAFKSLSPDIFARAMSKLVTGSEQVQANRVYDGMAKFYNWYNSQPESPLIADNIAVRDMLGVALTLLANGSSGRIGRIGKLRAHWRATIGYFIGYLFQQPARHGCRGGLL